MILRLLWSPFRLLANLVRVLLYGLALLGARLARMGRRGKKLYLRLELSSAYDLGPARGLQARLFQNKPNLMDLRKELRQIAADAEVRGVLVRLESAGMGLARTAELMEMLAALREAGKHVVIHADTMGIRELYLASAADQILVAPAGRLYTFGPRFEQIFFAGALDKIGVRPQFVHLGHFKTASHQWLYSEMTAPQRLMMRELHDRILGLYVERLSAARELTGAQVIDALAHAPLTPRNARVHGLLDGTVFEDAAVDWLAHGQATTPRGESTRRPRLEGQEEAAEVVEAASEDGRKRRWPRLRRRAADTDQVDQNEEVVLVPAERCLDATPELNWRPLLRRKRRARLAVIDLTGAILQESINLPAGGPREAILPSEVLPVLRAVRDDRHTQGLLVHINSPGGSAVASDQVWHALEEVRSVKPVVAFLSDIAASGGYYIATGADQIICRPETVTGSIGVVAGSFSMGEALERLHVHREAIYDLENTSFISMFDGMDEETLSLLQRDARDFYRRFLDRVGQARNIPRRRLHRYARGRIYTGRDAQRRGLVDGLGGFGAALDGLAELCARPLDELEVNLLTHQKHGLRDLLRRSGAEALTGLSPQALSRALDPLLVARMLAREQVLYL